MCRASIISSHYRFWNSLYRDEDGTLYLSIGHWGMFSK